MRRRLTIASVVIVMLSVTACGADELDGFLDALGTADLGLSADPVQRAAGETPIEVLSAREAENNLARGLMDSDVSAIQQAAALRPGDPRYPMHEAVLLEATDGPGASMALETAMALVTINTPGWLDCNSPETLAEEEACNRTIKDSKRRGLEAYLDATLEAIRATADPTIRSALTDRYCEGINSEYPSAHTDDFPQEVSLYLAIQADFTVCP